MWGQVKEKERGKKWGPRDRGDQGLESLETTVEVGPYRSVMASFLAALFRCKKRPSWRFSYK